MAKSNVFLLAAVLLATLAPLDTKKDVLFIAVDDLRPDLSFYGETIAKTPNLDALAAKSMIFERAYCQVATCSPSRTALLTGRRPDTNHVWIISPDEYWRMFTNATSIPQYFKENGYRSMGMGKIFHPGLPSGKDDGNYSWSYPYFHGHNKVSLKARNSWNSFENISDSDLRDGQIADKAIEYIQTINMNRTKGDMTPFFLAVGFHKPHLPFYAPSKYYDIYPPAEEIGLAKNPNAPNKMPPIAWAASGEMRNYADMHMFNLSECYDNATASMTGKQCHISDSVAHQLRRGYHACQTYTDAQIGRVLDEFQAKGLAKDAIIVLWGDHGWKLGEHNMWGKHTNLEDDTHVPFLLRVPGVTDGGMRTDALVELIDMFPTVTELAGLPVPPLCPADNKDMLTCVEGTSVAPLLKDPKQKWKKSCVLPVCSAL